MQYLQTLCWPKQFEESDPNFRPVTLLNSLEGCCSSPCLVNTRLIQTSLSLLFLGGLLSHPSRGVRPGTVLNSIAEGPDSLKEDYYFVIFGDGVARKYHTFRFEECGGAMDVGSGRNPL
ncbi:hypothetical protein CDAR_250031 [Caerostris darwini]|uniref:Uncharacterized protein n=1 Tax=Caerostris darwini TaxID=1538125 RepID=A0AAV4R4Q4_9ARAC|nr:hypothetical protein CDAR_250031 [Caerostris darwini]